jgi:predicted nucleic acid-binding protein
MYLVDTNVISAGASTKAVSVAELIKWMDEHSSELYLSVVTVAEIEAGIAKARRERARRKATDLTAWLDALLHLYGERVLAFDVAAARVAGELSDLARSKGVAPGFADIVIGATARTHQLTILTRNVRHFVPLGVPSIDPLHELP